MHADVSGYPMSGFPTVAFPTVNTGPVIMAFPLLIISYEYVHSTFAALNKVRTTRLPPAFLFV